MSKGKTLVVIVCVGVDVFLCLTSHRYSSDIIFFSPLGPTPRCLHIVTSWFFLYLAYCFLVVFCFSIRTPRCFG